MFLPASVQALSHSTRCCGESEESETLVAADRIERKVFVEVCLLITFNFNKKYFVSYLQSVFYLSLKKIKKSRSSTANTVCMILNCSFI